MAKRALITPHKALDNVDLASNQTQAAPYTTIDNIDKIGVDIVWTGTSPVGEIFVEVAYLLPNSTIYTTWQALSFGASIAISGNAGNHLLCIQDPPFQKIRLRYAKTSGTGNLTATLFAASKGA